MLHTSTKIKQSTFFQVFLLEVQSGINFGWASPNIARFRMNTSEISVLPKELPWVASFDTFGTFFGAILGPIAIEFFGPKQTGVYTFIFFTGTWLSIMFSVNSVWLIVSRFFGGLTASMANICTAMFLGEVSEPKIRGTIISIALTGFGIGLLFGNILETYLPRKLTCTVYLIQCFIGIPLIVFILPESPYFLMKSRDEIKTRKSIKMYFPNLEVEEKLIEVKKYVEDQASVGLKDKLKIIKSKPVKKSFIVIIILSTLVHTSGVKNIVHYMEIILRRGKSLLIEPRKLVIYINLLSIAIRFVSCSAIDRFGRKFLLMTGSIFMSLTMVALGFYFHVLNSNSSVDGYEWIPAACILLSETSFSIGFHSGLITVVSEIFPLSVKNMGFSISYVISAFFSFLLTAAFLPISDTIGEQYIFWIHAVCGFLVSPLVILFLPETKGKTLEEIQASLLKK